MQKILLDTDNEKLNQRQALRIVNNSMISRDNLCLNFIKADDKHYCLITTSNEEREGMPEELRQTAITYKKLQAKALS